MQIYCMAALPSQIEIGRNLGSGCMIPGTMAFRLELSRRDRQARDYHALCAQVISALRQGDNAYIHCMAGIHRGPVGGAIIPRGTPWGIISPGVHGHRRRPVGGSGRRSMVSATSGFTGS